MKKILIVLSTILCIIISTVCSVTADTISDELEALKVIPSDFATENDELINRAEFAYIASMLMQNRPLEPQVTKFSDVTKDNPYSGAIEYLSEAGIINGVGDGLYNPNGYVTAEMSYKIMINILGYNKFADDLGGYPDGYVSAANKLGLANEASFFGGYLTKKGAISMAHFVLTNAFDTPPYIDYTVLAKRYKINVYHGIVENSNNDYTSLKITGNKYNTNPIILEENQIHQFYSNGKNLCDYEGAHVTVWVNDREEIIHIEVRKNSKIVYGYVDSVNGSESETNIPSVASLSRLTLLNDENDYEIASGVKVRYNGEMTQNTVGLVGNFARIVLLNDKITFIETWDSSEGGIITGVSLNSIEYTKGNRTGLKIDDFDKFTNKRIYIDKVPAAEGHIKADSIFDYWATDDSIVLMISEKKIIDELYGCSSTSLEIGDASYKYKQLYYSDGTFYRTGNEYKEFIGSEISAYIGPDEYVRYIKAGAVNKSNFYGFVHKVFRSEEESDEFEVVVWVYGDEIEKKTYKTNKKTKFYDGLSILELENTARSFSGDGIYEFVVRNNGYIREIKKMIPFYGYGVDIDEKDKKVKALLSGSLAGNSNPSVTMEFKNKNQETVKKKLYFKNTPMVAINNNNGEFVVSSMVYTDIVGKYFDDDITMTFYGDEHKKDIPSLIVLTGNGLKTTSTNKEKEVGIVVAKEETITDDGEIITNLHITKGDETPVIYTVSSGTVKDLPLYSIVMYKEASNLSEEPIIIDEQSIYPLAGGVNRWNIQTTEGADGLHEGRFDKIEGKRLYLQDTAYYLDPASNELVVRFKENGGKRTIEVIESSEIRPGEYIYYYLTDNGVVRAIIVEA